MEKQQMTASRGLRGGRIEQKEKRTHGHGQQCGDSWGEGGIRELNDNSNKYNKDLIKNKHNHKFKKSLKFKILLFYLKISCINYIVKNISWL